jgi:putative Mg2+ transporter-C (MgtC) family protein
MVASRSSDVPEPIQLHEPVRSFHFNDLEQMLLASGVGKRLLVACVLGGAIGMEREYHKKSLGLRTNLLICCGCAMFTFLSAVLAGDNNPDKGRVAANIVQGIGFLGAGLIMRNRFRVSGLTNAATVFVVASIGMACGAGLYAPAALATAIVLIALTIIGMLETRFNIKMFSLVYEVRGEDRNAIQGAVLNALDLQGKRLVEPEQDVVAQLQRISFSVLGTSRPAQVPDCGPACIAGRRQVADLSRCGGRVIPFVKAHACGNDFLVVQENLAGTEAQGRSDAEALPPQPWHRSRRGGVPYLGGERRGKIRLHNADGSIAEISGNGTRCAAAWIAYETKAGPGDEIVLETDAGSRLCRIDACAGPGLSHCLPMGVPEVQPRKLAAHPQRADRGCGGLNRQPPLRYLRRPAGFQRARLRLGGDWG